MSKNTIKLRKLLINKSLYFLQNRRILYKKYADLNGIILNVFDRLITKERRKTKHVEETFISSYLKHTSIYESPSSFWKWSAYASVAALLRDHCYLKQGDRLLFPNVYILFLAESGTRKGPPVDLSETLISKIQITKVISGRASVQAILDELARAETDKTTGKVLKAGAAIFYAAEMAAGIVADPEALKILTDIYDYKTNPYKSRLRTGPCFNLDRIVFSMLAASNEAMLKGLFGIAEIQGGFLARIFLVTPNEQRPPNSLMRLDPEERRASLIKVYEHFQQIAKLKGEFKLEEDAVVEYEQWYYNFKLSYQTKKEVSGIIGRIHTHVIKLAMILAANECSLNVTKGHMELAINECLALLPNYSVFTMSNGKTEQSQAGGLILTELLNAKMYTMSRKELLRKHWQSIDAELLDKLIITLDQASMLQQIQTKDGLLVRLTPTCLEMLGSSK